MFLDGGQQDRINGVNRIVGSDRHSHADFLDDARSLAIVSKAIINTGRGFNCSVIVYRRAIICLNDSDNPVKISFLNYHMKSGALGSDSGVGGVPCCIRSDGSDIEEVFSRSPQAPGEEGYKGSEQGANPSYS